MKDAPGGEDPLLTVAQCAQLCRMAPGTWRWHTSQGDGPPADDPDEGRPVNRRQPRWYRSTVEAWEKTRPHEPGPRAVSHAREIDAFIRTSGPITPGRHSVTRQLARRVGCTVDRARLTLKQLEEEGYVTLERRGRRIARAASRDTAHRTAADRAASITW